LLPAGLDPQVAMTIMVGPNAIAISTFLKNNTKSQPAWQEIVDFS
jgi:L-2-hydroxyglutarate oxidase LhgO